MMNNEQGSLRREEKFTSHVFLQKELAILNDMPMNKKPDAHTLIIAVKNGERLSDLSKKWNLTVSFLKWMLKKEGIDYRKIVLERKAEIYEQQFNECLKLSREKGRVPTFHEFKQIGITSSRVRIFIQQLKDKGFGQQVFNRSRIEDDELLKELYMIYKKTGIMPGYKHTMKYSRYSVSTYVNHFGSLANAIKKMQKQYPDTGTKND